MEIKKPTKKQAIEILCKKVEKEIVELEEKVSKKKLFLNNLILGKVEVDISEHKGRWHLNAKKDYESAWDIVDQTKIVETRVSKF